MAERKATNKYYPPEWTPEQGSLNKFHGQHPLRERASKLSQGILVIRFEMPFNIWCGGCKAHIGKGVRYNAQKKQAGKYFTTKIWSFRMKCHLCDNWFEIHTDPKACEYVIVSGATRKNEEWEPDDTQIQLPSEEETKKKADNAFYKLEHAVEDEKKQVEELPRLARIQRRVDELSKDPYSMSQLVRRKFRAEKVAIAEKKKEDEKLVGSWKVAIPLLEATSTEKELASKVKFTPLKISKFSENKLRKRLTIKASSIFESSPRTEAQHRLETLLKSRKLGVSHTMFENPIESSVSTERPVSSSDEPSSGFGTPVVALKKRPHSQMTSSVAGGPRKRRKGSQASCASRAGAGADQAVAETSQRAFTAGIAVCATGLHQRDLSSASPTVSAPVCLVDADYGDDDDNDLG